MSEQPILLKSVLIFTNPKGQHNSSLAYQKMDEVQYQTSIYVATEDIPAGVAISDARWAKKLDNSTAYQAELARQTAEGEREQAEEAREQAEGLREQGELAREEAYSQAESARDSLYESAESARDDLFAASQQDRTSAYGLRENQRDSAYQAAESARDGLYEAAEASREQAFEAAEIARNQASDAAATSANEAAQGALQATTDADAAAEAANQAALNASDKATLANNAAGLATEKAGLADAAAGVANTKAALADEKAVLANTAADNANTAAQNAIDYEDRTSLWRTAEGNPVTVYPVPESTLYPRVELVATQSGSGDPSPENIRPIVPSIRAGETVKAKRTGKNLLDVSNIKYYSTASSSYCFVLGNAGNQTPGNQTLLLLAGFTYMLSFDSALGTTSLTVNTRRYGGDTYEPFATVSRPANGHCVFSFTPSETGLYGLWLWSGVASFDGKVSNFQLEIGFTATPYDPYTAGAEYDLYTADQDLYGLPDAPVVVDTETGTVTVKDEVKVLDGNESWNETGYTGTYFLAFPRVPLVGISSHYKEIPLVAQLGTTDGIFWRNETGLFVSSASIATIANWKAYLAAQYAAGTPVVIQYQLATPTTTPIAPPAIHAFSQMDRITPRQNIITVDKGSLSVVYAESPILSVDEFTNKLNKEHSAKMMKYEHISQMRFYGTTHGMTKDVPKTLRFEYKGARNYINDSAGTGKRESGVSYSGYAEVKWQGSSSLAFPKKNFTVKLFEDAELTAKKNIALRTAWGEQNKYCMKANFIDPTQCRNVVAAKLWGDCVRSRNTTSESYIRMNALPNAGAVDGYPVLTFINDQYVGLYTMNIPKDEWTFGMKDGEGTNVVLCGELHAPVTRFEGPALVDGSDWDYEVEPADKSGVAASFNQIYAALALPETNEPEKTAKKQALEAVVDIYSVIDYQIFLDALCITDNTGKNQLLVTYDGVKWIMSAYDLDTAFGLRWSGAQYLSANQVVGSNNLINVVARLYPTELNARKTELKSGVLSRQKILETLLNFAIDIPQEAYRAEAELWPDQCGANANAMQQITSFVMTRPQLNP